MHRREGAGHPTAPRITGRPPLPHPSLRYKVASLVINCRPRTLRTLPSRRPRRTFPEVGGAAAIDTVRTDAAGQFREPKEADWSTRPLNDDEEEAPNKAAPACEPEAAHRRMAVAVGPRARKPSIGWMEQTG